MVIVKADADTEAGKPPSPELIAAMGQYNEQLVRAGVLLAGEGLMPSSKGARVRFSGSRRTVIDGPFTETKELVAGFWLWQVKSKEEAIEWVRRCPNPLASDTELEIREVSENCGVEARPAKKAVEAVPESRGATPYLVVKGASDAIAFYQRVFGADLLFRLDDPSGAVMHAELRVGPAHFMVTEERPQHGALGPLTLGGSGSSATLYVPDADAVVERAVKAGAKVVMPVQDQFWGDRCGNIVDPFGHLWFVSTHIEDPTPQEIEQRAKALFARGAC
jgi:uncharacterized glyoxalase superfamily protein PhnB